LYSAALGPALPAAARRGFAANPADL